MNRLDAGLQDRGDDEGTKKKSRVTRKHLLKVQKSVADNLNVHNKRVVTPDPPLPPHTPLPKCRLSR